MKIKFDINYSEEVCGNQKKWCELDLVDDKSIVYDCPNAVQFGADFITRLLAFVQNRFADYRVVLFHMEEKDNRPNYPPNFYPTLIRWEKK